MIKRVIGAIGLMLVLGAAYPVFGSDDEWKYYSYKFPNVIGKSRSEAEQLFKANGYQVTIVEGKPQLSTQIGKVIDQDPKGEQTHIILGKWKKPIVLTIGADGGFVPDTLLKTESEAVNLVKKAGYVPRVVYYPETVGGMVGKVKNSEPLPHRALPPGATVQLIVGRSSFDMPNLIGAPLAHATQSLDMISQAKSLNLKYTVATKDTQNMADDGKVFDQNPKTGAALAPGSAVALSVYRWVYPMPNFTGMTDKEAFAALNQVNSSRPGFIKMSAAQTKDSANQKDHDRIHDQNPKPGTIVQPGATAIVYTYKYQPSAPAAPATAYVVPNVVNKNEHDAAREILKAGGKLLPTQYTLTSSSRSGRVMAQSIPAGTKTAEGVCLTVGKSR